MPADLMMSGDFYDWQALEGGRLDLTVADVMGKGPAAALLMTALRTSLRAVSSDLDPAARLSRAAEPLVSIAAAGDRFVTVFHARVELATGRLDYVDAGHGHWAIRRAGGELVRPGGRSLPMFVAPEVPFAQGTARLAAGDALVVYSDGLVEVGERIRTLEDYAADVDEEADAETMVTSMLGRLPAFLPDDATVVVLRRVG
jgi:serine phosphatase RsbU (regulator of sigma subunit)